MKSRALWIVLGVVVLLGAWMWTGFNGLVTSKAAVDTAWADVQTQYQRRFDLVPNLVNTVKGAANFEQSTLTQVTAARSAWATARSSGSLPQQITAAQGFDSALSRLLVTVEAYPQLQATQAFRDLMAQLEGTENRISTARRDYNQAVQGYNVRIRTFPTNVLAGVFGFQASPLFEAATGADQAPRVDFGSSSVSVSSK